jgi:hypothetical protein
MSEQQTESAVELLRRLKRDLMHTRRFGDNTMASYRRACSSAEGDIEEWLKARAETVPHIGQPVQHYIGGRMVQHVETPPGMEVKVVSEGLGVSKVVVNYLPVPERLPGEKFSDWAKRTYALQAAPRCPEGGECTGNCDHCRTGDNHA